MTEERKDVVAKSNDIKNLIMSDSAKKQFALSLPKHLSPDRFVRVALTAFNKTPKLLTCTKESLTECLMSCSELGLEPDGRRVHLIPYGNKCTLIIDYKGLVALARRSGEVADIHADVVCENDKFDYSFGTNGNLEHRPAIATKGKVIAAYSFVKLKDGSTSYEVMNKEEIDAIRKRSKAANNGPWVTDWNEMAKKTVFRRHSKWLPLSAEFRDAVDKDYDVPIDIMKSADIVGKPEVTQPVAISDKTEEPQPETKKSGAPQIGKSEGAKTDTSKKAKEEKPETKKKENSEYGTMLKDFQGTKQIVGEKVYYEILGSHGFEKSNQIKSVKKGGEIITEMLKAAKDNKEERIPGQEG